MGPYTSPSNMHCVSAPLLCVKSSGWAARLAMKLHRLTAHSAVLHLVLQEAGPNIKRGSWLLSS